jgi:Glycosyltransferase family 87
LRGGQRFWSAGKLVLGGTPAAAYDLVATGAIQASEGFANVFAFVNPPPFLLLVWPLGALDYPAAWLAWVVLTYLVWLAASRPLAGRYGWPLAAYPGALLAATHAQTGFVTGAMQAGVARSLDRRPFVAGLCLAGLVIKPQLAVLVPVALVAGGYWRALAGAIFGVLLALGAAWLILGSDTMVAYTASWEVSRVLMNQDSAVFFLRQATIYAQFRAWGMPLAAGGVQLLASLGAVWLTWRAWSRTGEIDGKFALLFALTPLATPYLFNYDLAFLAIPTLWLAGKVAQEPRQRWERAEVLALYCGPALARAFAIPLGVNLTAEVCLLLAFRIWQRLGPAN